MNSNTFCIACRKGREKQESSILVNGKPRMVFIPLIKHHVCYEPEKIAYVHFSCHQDIHSGKYPFLIQYQDGESRKHYKNK